MFEKITCVKKQAKSVIIITPSHNTLNVLIHLMGCHMGEGVAPSSYKVGRLIHGTGGRNQTNKSNKNIMKFESQRLTIMKQNLNSSFDQANLDYIYYTKASY
jgi:hypothetical protein